MVVELVVTLEVVVVVDVLVVVGTVELVVDDVLTVVEVLLVVGDVLVVVEDVVVLVDVLGGEVVVVEVEVVVVLVDELVVVVVLLVVVLVGPASARGARASQTAATTRPTVSGRMRGSFEPLRRAQPITGPRAKGAQLEHPDERFGSRGGSRAQAAPPSPRPRSAPCEPHPGSW